jgi:3-hydroxyacyl-[acyl-carrier-protein] dehydratase
VAKTPSSKDQIVSFSEFDLNNSIASKEEIEAINPHRHELALLDGILFEDAESGRAVGFHDVRDDEFWVRGHFPEKALMPGVVICECAAQLCAYFARRSGLLEDCIIALGGLDDIKFRGPVVPGDRLVMMLQKTKGRRNMLIVGRFQCFVGDDLVVEGIIKGVALREA